MKWKKMLVGLTALSLMSGWMSLPEQAVISAVVPSLAIVASAESEEAAEYKDLDISVTSNKSEYSVNETAEITIVAKNTSDNVLKDVILTGCIPNNLEVDENDKTSLTVKEIKPEESIELLIHVRYVDEGIDSTTESNLSDSNSSSEDNSSNSGSATNSNTSIKTDENPKTGSNIDDVFAIAVVAMLIAIVSMGFSKNKKVNKMLALLICVGMTSSFVLPNISASAETNEDENLMSGFSIAMPLTIYFGDAHFNFTAYAEYKNPVPFSYIDITDVEIPFSELTEDEDEGVSDYIDLLFPTKVTKELDISDDALAATDVTVNYEVENGTAIVNITDIADYSYMSKVPGAIGRPVDISLYNDTLKQADIIFSYDESKLNGSEDSLGVCYYDEENNIVVLVYDVVIDTKANTVTVHTDHFSQWILIETNEWYDAWAQEQLIVRNDQGTETPYYNVIFALDNSGSMGWDSKMTACKEATKQFISQLDDNDMISVTTFSDDAIVYIENAVLKELRNELYMPTGTNKYKYEDTIDGIYDDNGTNFEKGLYTVLSLIVNKGDKDNSKESDGIARQDMIVFLSDGVPTTDYFSDTLDLLRQLSESDNLKMITLGLGYDVSEYYMKEMAEVGNGKYFFISDASEVADVFDEVNGLFIGSSKDADEDGIPDIVESTGMRNQYGEIIKTDPNNPDSDGDEIPDGVEMGEFYQPPNDPDTGEVGKPYFKMTSDPKTPTYFSDKSKIISGNAEITFDYIRKDLERMTIAQVADILKEYKVTYTALAVKHENSILSEIVYEDPKLTIVSAGSDDNCNIYNTMVAENQEYTIDNDASNANLKRDEVTVENTVIGTDGKVKSSGITYFAFINYFNIVESYTTECVNTKTASDSGWAGISDFAANICDSKHETTIYITNNNGDIDGDSEVSTSCDFHEKFAEFLKERQAQKDRTTKNNRKKAQAELDKLGKKLETQAAEINSIFDEITTITNGMRKEANTKLNNYNKNAMITASGSYAMTSITDRQLLEDANKAIYEKLVPEMEKRNQAWVIKGTDWFNFLKSFISSLNLGQDGIQFTSNNEKYTIKIDAGNYLGATMGTGTITNDKTGKKYSIMVANIDPQKYKESMENLNDWEIELYRDAMKKSFKEALGVDMSVDYILKNSGYEVSGWKEKVTHKVADFLVSDFFTCLTHVDGYKAGKIAEALNKLQNEDYIYTEVYKKLGELARNKLIDACGGNQTLADMIWPEKDWWWTKEDQPWYKKYTQAIENAGDNDAMRFINALGSAAEAMEDANSGVPKAIEETSRRINDIKSILDAVPK